VPQAAEKDQVGVDADQAARYLGATKEPFRAYGYLRRTPLVQLDDLDLKLDALEERNAKLKEFL